MRTKDSTTYKSLGWMGFGTGTIPTAVDTLDGRAVRIRPMHYSDVYTSEQLREWKVEARGHTFKAGMKSYPSMLSLAYRERAQSKNRLEYPLKRVDWDPKGDRNPQNRGKSPYVRISWDEAAQLIADEMERIKATYGTTAIFAQADGHGEEKTIGGGHGTQTHLLDIYGPYTVQARQSDSWEGWYWGAKHMWGMEPVGRNAFQTNLFKDISENADAVLLWGCDPETTNEGFGGLQPCRMESFWNEIGITEIAVAPDFNYAAAAHADKWFPVLPNTDAALQLAIMYVWMTEGTFDREYVDSHTVGFDWLEYEVLRGGEDGEPRTPKWAEAKCGIPARRIKALARYWAKRNVSIIHGEGGSYIRSAYSHEPARLEVALMAMQQLGHPGRNVMHMQSWNLYYIESLSAVPTSGIVFSFYRGFTGHNLDTANMKYFIPQTLVPEAILNKEPISWYGKVICSLPMQDQYQKYTYPREGASRIHMIWTDTPCWETCWNGGAKMQDALRDPEIECVVAQHPWFENDVRMADIILPTTTKLEERDIAQIVTNGQYDMGLNELPACERRGEAKTDFEAVLMVAEKLGLEDQLVKSLWGDFGIVGLVDGELPYDEIIRHVYEVSGLLHEGENPFMAAAGIGDAATDDSVRREGIPDFEEFCKQGFMALPVKRDWQGDAPGLIGFWKDPEQNPLPTASGKIEIYSSSIAGHWPDDDERKPYPRWIEQGQSHEERLTNPRGKAYPYLLVSNHPHFRVHAQHDDIPWLREDGKVIGPDGYGYEPVWVNPVDAAEKGVVDGDVVRIFNERGSVLGGVKVTERIAPRSISQDHGARVDTVVYGEGGLERGGANNMICPSNTTSKNCAGEVTSGYLVDFEKVDVFELARKYPEAFGRPFDPEYGQIAAPLIVEA